MLKIDFEIMILIVNYKIIENLETLFQIQLFKSRIKIDNSLLYVCNILIFT